MTVSGGRAVMAIALTKIRQTEPKTLGANKLMRWKLCRGRICPIVTLLT